MTNDVMLRDIQSQGDALAEGLGSLRAQASAATFRPHDRIVVTGSGDSFIAAAALQALLQQHHGIPVLALPSLDAGRYLATTPGDLVVVISVSGEVARTIEVAERAKAAGSATAAITAVRDSRLGLTCDVALTIPAPIDRSIPHSRDYSVTLLALACLLERLADIALPELDDLPALVRTVLARSFHVLQTLTIPTGRTWFLGAGPDRATAKFGALKFWEAAGMEAWWDDLEEFGHGSQLMSRPGDRAVLIASGPGCQRAGEMVGGLEKMGMDVLLVGGTEMASDEHPHLFTTDDLDPALHPLVSCLPLQVLTYLQAEARGLDVSVPLFGRSYGPTYHEVHAEWVRTSKVVPADRWRA